MPDTMCKANIAKKLRKHIFNCLEVPYKRSKTNSFSF